MLVVHAPDHARHHPQMFLARGRVKPNEERPERADRLLAAATAAGHAIALAPPGTRAMAAMVHSADFLDYLETAWTRWQELPGAGPEIVPNIHPTRHMAAVPSHPVPQAGWYISDTACALGEGTWTASLAAVGATVGATEAVLAGAPVAYALARPPGHHAYRDMAGGGCFLNNVAIAAEMLRGVHARVAILDVDVHHGNGTQGIFWERPDVFFASIHGDPTGFYPFFAGYADEVGAGAGQGANLNLPLPIGTDDTGYLPALDRALDGIREFHPTALAISLGLDAAAGDPLGAMRLTTAGFAEIARRIAGLGLPTVLVQEGGYLSDALGPNLAGFLRGFEGGRS